MPSAAQRLQWAAAVAASSWSAAAVDALGRGRVAEQWGAESGAAHVPWRGFAMHAPHRVMRREAESSLVSESSRSDESLLQEVASSVARRDRQHSGGQQALTELQSNPWDVFAKSDDGGDAPSEDMLDIDEPTEEEPMPRAISALEETDRVVMESEKVALEADKLKAMIEHEAGVPEETVEEEVEKEAQVKHADEAEAKFATICVIVGVVGSVLCWVGSMAWLGAVTWSGQARGKDADIGAWGNAYSYDAVYDGQGYDQAYDQAYDETYDQGFVGEAAEGEWAEEAETQFAAT